MQAQHFWSKVYQRNIGKMIGTCYRYVGDRAVAEDLAHESFLKAIEKSSSYKRLGSFDGWLMRICLNTTLDYLRRQPHFLSIEEIGGVDDPAMDVETQSIASLQDNDYTEDEILSAICALPDKQRAVFNLYVFEKQKHETIAQNLQIGVRSSKRYLSEARAQLQQTLKNMKEHKKSGVLMLLSILPWKSHAIDRICRAKLNHLSMAPCNPSVLSASQWATVPQPSSWLVLSAAKAPAIATGVITTAVAGSVAIWQAQPSEPMSPRILESAVDTVGIQMMPTTQNPDTVSSVETMCTSSLQNNNSDIFIEQKNPSTEQQTQCPAPTLSETHQTLYAVPKSNHSLTKFWRNGYCGLQDEKGNIIVYPKYTDIGPFDEYRSGWAMVDLFGFKGFIDTQGREVVHPQYDEIGAFGFYQDGRALVRKGSFYGFIDLTGKEVVPVVLQKKWDGRRMVLQR